MRRLIGVIIVLLTCACSAQNDNLRVVNVQESKDVVSTHKMYGSVYNAHYKLENLGKQKEVKYLYKYYKKGKVIETKEVIISEDNSKDPLDITSSIVFNEDSKKIEVFTKEGEGDSHSFVAADFNFKDSFEGIGYVWGTNFKDNMELKEGNNILGYVLGKTSGDGISVDENVRQANLKKYDFAITIEVDVK